MGYFKKDFNFIFLFVIIILFHGISSCSMTKEDTVESVLGTPPSENPSVLVTFDSLGGDPVNQQTVQVGSTITKPSNPYKQGFGFEGWFTEPSCENKWNFEVYIVESQITLYAKWHESTPGLAFHYLSDTESYSVGSGTTGNTVLIIIPAYWCGYPITEIVDEGFKDTNYLNTIVLPRTLEIIGVRAFQDSAVENINFPSSLKEINYRSFLGCHNLTAIVLPEGLKIIGLESFRDSSITEISLPSTVIEIGGGAFESCMYLSSVQLSEGLQRIKGYSFAWCGNLKTIELPQTLTYIDEGAFYRSGLTTIEIPENISTISEDAFLENYDLTSVQLSEGIQYLNLHCFADCTSLTEISIPKTVQAMTAPFSGCTGLNTMYLHPSTAPVYSTAISNCTLHIPVVSNGYDDLPWANETIFPTVIEDL